MKHEVLDLCGLLSGRGRRAGQERWALGLEALGVLAEAVGLPRVLVLAVGNLRETAAPLCPSQAMNACILHSLKHLDMP